MYIMNKDGNTIINADNASSIYVLPKREKHPVRIAAGMDDGEAYVLSVYRNEDDALEELDYLYEALVTGCVGVNFHTNEKTALVEEDDDED